MNLTADTLTDSLQKGVALLYLIVGSDPLLVRESETAIIRAIQKQHSAAIHRIDCHRTVDWRELESLHLNLTLFGNRQLFLFSLPEKGLTRSFYEPFEALKAKRNATTFWVILMANMSQAVREQGWFTALLKEGICITCHTPAAEALPQWIASRSQARGISCSDAAVQLLADYHENNLLLLDERLTQLRLLYPKQRIEVSDIMTIFQGAASFSVSNWVEAVLSGNRLRAEGIIKTLRREGHPLLALFRTLQQMVSTLLLLQQAKPGVEQQKLLTTRKIWRAQQRFFITAGQRITKSNLLNALKNLAEMERDYKLSRLPEGLLWEQVSRLVWIQLA